MCARKVMVAALAGLSIALGMVGVLVVAGRGAPPASSPESPPVLPVLPSGQSAQSAEAEPTDGAIEYVGPLFFETTTTLDVLGGEEQAWYVGEDLDLYRLATLASALKLLGSVDETDEGWEVVDGDRRLSVRRQPGLSWSYTTAAPPDTSSPPLPSPPPAPLADPVAAEEARVLAGEVATAAGMDLARAGVRTNQAHRSQWVGFEPAVAGVPTLGMSTSVLVGPSGEVEQASGYLAMAQPGAVFPLLGTDAALDRLHRVQPVPPGEGNDASVVEVTGVISVLRFVSALGANRAWLVPAYAYETVDGALWGRPLVVAVADEYMAEPPEPEQEVPAPADTRRCVDTGVGADDGPGDQVPGVKVCLDGDATADRVAIFELAATDADTGGTTAPHRRSSSATRTTDR